MDADIIIVGGGPAGTGMLVELANRAGRVFKGRRGRVVLLERDHSIGSGLPFGEAADPKHTLGRVAVRRREKGEKLLKQVQGAFNRLREQRVEVDVELETNATDLQGCSGDWRVHTSQATYQGRRIVLATGHWHTQRLREISRVVDWRWDVRLLHSAVRDEDDVVVLGTSQSAIDVALTLGMRRWNVSGARVGSIILASRRGLLPRVVGLPAYSMEVRYRAPHLDALRDKPTVRLREIFDAICRNVTALGGDPAEDFPALGFPTQPVDAVVEFLHDLAEALSARREERRIPWQVALWHSMAAVSDLFPRLVAEDRLALEPHWSQCLRLIEAIHIPTAQQMVALIEAGLVRVVTLGEHPVVVEDARGVSVRGISGEIRGDRLIDARGPDPRIEHADDAFLQSLLAAGHIVEARIPFLNAQSVPPDDDRVITREGRPFLVTGGVWFDPRTFQVLNDAGRWNGISTLGALTQGQLPLYLGLWGIRHAAARIASDMEDTLNDHDWTI